MYGPLIARNVASAAPHSRMDLRQSTLAFLLFVERLPEEIDQEAGGNGGSLALRKAGG
jgi:hypothetical protein